MKSAPTSADLILEGLPGPEPRSLSERAYGMLVRLITRLELEPGAVLVEKELIIRLGIGRTPIREALQRLAVEGLVVHRPNRGMFVAEITASGVQQIYEFRALIDASLVRLAAQRATPDQIEELRAVCRELAEATRTDDLDCYVALDRMFYDVLARSAQNAYLAEVVPRIFHLHVRLWFFISARERSTGSVAKAHAEMAGAVAAAIARRDGEGAARAIEAYVARRHQDIKKLI
jgi:DNA-binding GntR family transcriptional regulator